LRHGTAIWGRNTTSEFGIIGEFSTMSEFVTISEFGWA
jgi:hypothetical protein